MTTRLVSPVPETPRSFGFRMPAEWEPHEATWIAWPHNHDDWPGRFEPIPWVYGEIVRKLSQVERVRILLQNDDVEQNARTVLEKSGVQWEAIEFYPMPTDRVWARDFAPLFVKNPAGELAAVKWRFNGWAKYDNHLRDEAAGPRACRSCLAWISGARDCPRRWQRGCQWRGPSAHHRGMSAEPDSGP